MVRTCPACGRSWKQRQATFCGACGASLAPAAPIPDERARSPSRASGGLKGVVLLIGAVLLVGTVGWVTTALGPGSRPGSIERVDDPVTVPGDAPPAPQPPGVAPEIVATCQATTGPTGCVRWVQRAGLAPELGLQALAVVEGDRVGGLDPETGLVRWTVSTEGPAAAPVAVGDHTVLVEDSAGVRALDARDGSLQWSAPGQHVTSGPPDASEPQVVVLEDLDGHVSGWAVDGGAPLWTVAIPLTMGPSLVVPVDPHTAVVGYPGGFTVIDLDTGEPLWGGPLDGEAFPERLLAVTPRVVVSAVAEPGVPLQLRRTGDNVFRLRDTATGADIDDLVLPAGDWLPSRIAVTDDLLLLDTMDSLHAYRVADATLAWQRERRGRVIGARAAPWAWFGQVAVQSSHVAVLSTDGTITIVDPLTGQDLLVAGEPDPGWISLASGFVTADRLWRVDATSVQVFDAVTGLRQLEVSTHRPIVLTTDPLVVVLTQGRLVRLDLP